MAIEIRELIISATVEEGASPQPQSAAAPLAKGESKGKEEIIQECVDQVMRILKQQARR